MNNKDYLADVDDIIRDGIYNAVVIEGEEIDPNAFLSEIRSRGKDLRVDLAFEILGATSRKEFEELVHELYLRGMSEEENEEI